MKKNLRLLIAAVIAISVCFTSCKKTDTTNNNNDDLITHSDDQARVAEETDEVANDANAVIDGYNEFSGRPPLGTVNNIVCHGTVVLDSTDLLRRLTITYNGVNCFGNRIRVGVVVLTMPLGTRWRDVGAVLTVDVRNLRITRVRDNRSITINGINTYTNVNGGLLRDLSTLGTIIHEIASPGITVSFDNGSQRSWQIGRRRVFTYDNGIVITTTGTHTDGATTGISEWGVNRFGNSFVTAITAPMVIRQDCDFRLVSGQVTHERLLANVVATFGLDATGVATSCPGAGTYYFKIVWTGANGIVRTYILPY